MSNEHPYPPCPSCAGTEFVNVPDVGVELQQAGPAILGHQSWRRAGYLAFSLVVCARCGKTDIYSKNATEMLGRVSGANTFRAVPPPR